MSIFSLGRRLRVVCAVCVVCWSVSGNVARADVLTNILEALQGLQAVMVTNTYMTAYALTNWYNPAVGYMGAVIGDFYLQQTYSSYGINSTYAQALRTAQSNDLRQMREYLGSLSNYLVNLNVSDTNAHFHLDGLHTTLGQMEVTLNEVSYRLTQSLSVTNNESDALWVRGKVSVTNALTLAGVVTSTITGDVDVDWDGAHVAIDNWPTWPDYPSVAVTNQLSVSNEVKLAYSNDLPTYTNDNETVLFAKGTNRIYAGHLLDAITGAATTLSNTMDQLTQVTSNATSKADEAIELAREEGGSFISKITGGSWIVTAAMTTRQTYSMGSAWPSGHRGSRSGWELDWAKLGSLDLVLMIRAWLVLLLAAGLVYETMGLIGHAVGMK